MYYQKFPLNNASCSDGANGLVTKFGYNTVEPMYPYVAAYSNISWNSPNCGQCMKVTYKGKSVHFTAID
jgi:hypothetical protein